MAKIIHSGDIHLDSGFSSLSKEEARIRRANSRALFSQLINIAKDENADVIILAGDIFDSYPIHPETEELFISELRRANIPIFITPGNHDPYSSDSPYKNLSFPENVHIFSSNTLTPVVLDDIKVRIFGAAYTGESYDDRIIADFKVPKDEFINIIALHSNLYTEGYSPVSVEEIGNTDADYVALAHIHKPTELMKSKNTFYAYCGCLECHDFGETYDSGFYIIDITKDKTTAIRKKISAISYHDITLNFEGVSDISSALPTPDGEVHLRLTLTGEAELSDVESIKNNLAEKYAEFILIDKTASPRDIWQGIEEDTLRGAFLRKIKTEIDLSTDDIEKKKLLLAAKYGIDAIENRDV